MKLCLMTDVIDSLFIIVIIIINNSHDDYDNIGN